MMPISAVHLDMLAAAILVPTLLLALLLLRRNRVAVGERSD